MFAIYFRHPETKTFYPCVSGRHMGFATPDTPPALYMQRKNAEKTLRDYKREAIDHYHAQGYNQYLAQFRDCPEVASCPVDIAIDMSNFHVVPVRVTPLLEEATPFA